MMNLSTITKAIRMRTLIAGIFPMMVGSFLAIEKGLFTLSSFFCIFLVGMSLQIMTNLWNDLSDFHHQVDTKERIGPARVIASGLMSQKELMMLMAFFASTFLVGTLPLALRAPRLVISLAAIQLPLVYFYSSTKFSITRLGLSEFCVFLFFGPLTTLLIHYIFTLTFSFLSALLGCIPGALCAMLVLTNNLRDEITDGAANRRTLVVRRGTLFGKQLFLGLWILALSIPCAFWLITWSHFPFMITSVYLLFRFNLVRQVWKASSPQDFVSIFPQTVKLLLGTLVASIYGFFL